MAETRHRGAPRERGSHGIQGLLSPMVKRQLLKQSVYYGTPREPDPTPMKYVICDTFGLDRAYGECPGPDMG